MKNIQLGAAGVLAVLIAGCSLPAAPPANPVASDVASRFVACLKSAGVEARIGEGGGLLPPGMVFVLSDLGTVEVEGEPGTVTSVSNEDLGIPAGSSMLMQMADDQGRSWLAVSDAGYFTTLDPDLHDAYAGCEKQQPDFTQPTFDPSKDPAFVQQQEDAKRAGLAFARCARDAGFGWVADPTEASSQSVVLPADLAEADFRAMLTACPATDGVTWMIEGDLGFDWIAVLDELSGGQGGGIVASGPKR